MGALFSSGIDEEIFDVVLDIDGTLVYLDLESPSPDFLIRNPNYRQAVPYSLAPGALEFLEVLSITPSCRLSFYSAGEKWRNTVLIHRLMQKVHMRLRELGQTPSTNKVVQFRGSHKILSREDVDRLGSKDLLKVHRNLSLTRAVLIDDTKTYSVGQEHNHISLYPGLGEKNLRRSDEESSLVHNNLVYALGKVLFFMEKWKTAQVDVPTLLAELKETEDYSSEVKANTRYRRQFYEIGLQAIRKLHPDFQLWSPKTVV